MKAKDLINVGIFTALYFVVSMITMISLLNPLLMPLGMGLTVLANGIVMMVFFYRSPRFGPLLLLAAIIGLFMTLSGHAIVTLPLIIITGAAGELVRYLGKYRRGGVDALAYAIFSLWIIGPLAPVFYLGNQYFENLNERMSARYPGYGTTLASIVSPTTVLILEVAIFFLALGGAWLGNAMLKKHFRRAGVV